MVGFARSFARRVLPYSVRKALYPVFFAPPAPAPEPASEDVLALLVTFDRRISNLESALAAQAAAARKDDRPAD